MQARSLRRRSAAHGSMNILGDLAQAAGPHTHTDWDRLGTLLSDHGDWRVAELTTIYRVPAEIMEFVAPLARTIAPTRPYPRPCARWARLRLDNALMVSRIGLYETELIKPRKPWRGLADVELATAEWVDWFNDQRLHTAIGDIPPHEHDDQPLRPTRAPTGGWRQRV